MYAYKELLKNIEEKLNSFGKPEFSEPPEGMGDISTNIAFTIAKKEGKNPAEVARGIIERIEKPVMIEKVEASGPYVNFFIDYEKFSEKVLSEAVREDYGSSNYGGGKTIVIDYSHPNIAKPMHVGHMRSTVIGNSLYRMFKFLGFGVIGVNHLGDFGLQFGKLLYAFKEWGSEEELEKNPIDYLVGLYVRFHEVEEQNPELKEKAEEWQKRLENRDPEAKALWEKFRELSIQKFEKVYKRMGVVFDSYKGEAYYVFNGLTKEVIKQALEKKVAVKEDEETVVVPLEEYGLPNARLLENGRSLYITRDLAAAIDRKKEYDFYKNIYVVSNAQSLHFQQLFKILELLGYEWFKDCEHVKFGLFSLPEGRISTRKGRFVKLEEVLDAAVEKAQRVIEEKNPGLEKKEEVAEKVGIGAVKFADLSQNRIKDVVFDLDRMVSFEGDTGPYLQYAHVRCKSILRKAGEQKTEVDYSLIREKEEKQLVMKIAEFPEVVFKAATSYEPHQLAQYLLELAHLFSVFYEKHKVMGNALRVQIVRAVANVLKNGLYLLGIEALDEM